VAAHFTKQKCSSIKMKIVVFFSTDKDLKLIIVEQKSSFDSRRESMRLMFVAELPNEYRPQFTHNSFQIDLIVVGHEL
jgi:hypothetical protein